MMATEHSTTTTKRKEPSAKVTIDALAEMFGLPAWERIDEMNLGYYAECAVARKDFLIETDATEEEIEEGEIGAERAAQDEVYRKWHGAVLYVAGYLFGEHGLELEPIAVKGAPANALAYEFRIIPTKSWQDAADKIRETINGVGMFHFANVAEFIATTEGTARRTVLAHLYAIRDYPAVYGSASAMDLYERGWS